MVWHLLDSMGGIRESIESHGHVAWILEVRAGLVAGANAEPWACIGTCADSDSSSSSIEHTGRNYRDAGVSSRAANFERPQLLTSWSDEDAVRDFCLRELRPAGCGIAGALGPRTRPGATRLYCTRGLGDTQRAPPAAHPWRAAA